MSLLHFTILFPLAGFFLLAFGRHRWSENTAAAIGVGALGLCASTTAYVASKFIAGGAVPYDLVLWKWIAIDGFSSDFALRLDGLSVTMLGVITGVGFFIHLFASWYMRGEIGYARFFSYMNLFVASMVVLVLGNNLMLMYLGWEGVGLCSYLLIGFYYRNPANGAAAMKAFIVTRVGDVFMAIGLFVLFRELGTLNIADILRLAPEHFQSGHRMVSFAALMLLGGAVGKSAQLPLQTWLADAMAGPTPVSALIHAATMVTAGVYLIARMHGIYLLAPEVLELVGWVGGVTLLLSGFSALVQTDIKRILAYSTMSQIGYMFLALGVGAWHAAIFHLMTHAFFKALLFLSSGAVIIAMHHEQNIFKMGGLWKEIPFVYACFLVGGSALAALPFVTAGFYSKDAILWQAQASGHHDLLVIGLIGAFMTSLYTFRLIFITFHGKPHGHAHHIHGVTYWLPLGVLLVLSTFIGAQIVPPLAGVLPEGVGEGGAEQHHLEMLSAGIAISGIVLSALLFLGERRFATALANSAAGRTVGSLWRNAWGFDWLYNLAFVRPFLIVARASARDYIDAAIGVVPAVAGAAHTLLSRTENGKLRWYAAIMATGALLVLALLFAGR